MRTIIACYVAIGALLLLLTRIAFGLAAGRRPPGPPRPVARRFLTPHEAAMLDAIERALPHCRIHAQVAMGALLAAPAVPGRTRRISDRNAFSQKIVDFVAQERATGTILALIEVDDRTHNPLRDARRDAMTAGAGYATIRIPGSWPSPRAPRFTAPPGIVALVGERSAAAPSDGRPSPMRAFVRLAGVQNGAGTPRVDLVVRWAGNCTKPACGAPVQTTTVRWFAGGE